MEDKSRDLQQRVSPSRSVVNKFCLLIRSQNVRTSKTKGEIAIGMRGLPESEFVEPSYVAARQESVFAEPNHHHTQHQTYKSPQNRAETKLEPNDKDK